VKEAFALTPISISILVSTQTPHATDPIVHGRWAASENIMEQLGLRSPRVGEKEKGETKTLSS
jgi:hypothetical protein